MGYTTYFEGQFTFNEPLNHEQIEFIQSFSRTRRMKRDVSELMRLYNGNFGLPLDQVSIGNDTRTPEEIYGNEGEFFVGNDKNDSSVFDYNTPPKNQPGLWCNWITSDGEILVCDDGENFYDYVEWMEYLVNHIFKKWNIVLNGSVEWNGEESDDFGQLIVTDNVVTTRKGTINYE